MSSPRSRAHPAISLEEACKDLGKIVEALGDGAHDRNAIATSLGYARGSGAAARRIAALSYYGLLDREEEGLFRPSSIGLALLDSEKDGWNQELLQECFLRPAVFLEVVEKYREKGAVPKLLAFALNRDHGITDSAKHDAATVFLESGAFAGVLLDDNSFTEEFLGFIDDPRKDEPHGASSLLTSVSGGGSAGERSRQNFQLSLSGGQATIELPENLTAADLKLLEKIFDLLTIQVESQKAPYPVAVRKRRGPS